MSNLTLVRNWWGKLAARERRLVLIAAWLVAALLVWWMALAPALATLKSADQQHLALDAQLQNMLALKAEAASLQSQVRAGGEDARRALESSLKQRFGAAGTLQFAGERATVNLKGVTGAALANWLVEVRAGARLLPAEVRLTRANVPALGAPAASVAATDLWDGSVVLNLLPR